MPKLPAYLKKEKFNTKNIERYKKGLIVKKSFVEDVRKYKNTNTITFLKDHQNLSVIELVKKIPFKINQRHKQEAIKIGNLKLKDLNVNQLKIIYNLLNPKRSSRERGNEKLLLEKNRSLREMKNRAIQQKRELQIRVSRIRDSESAIYLAKLLEYCKLHIENSANIILKDLPLNGRLTNKYKELFGDLTIKEISDVFKPNDVNYRIRGNLKDVKANLGIGN